MKERIPLLTLTKKDFRIDWFSGSGAGGQHRNKHQNCCRITHIETGISAQSTEHKNRPSNQREAFKELVKRLEPWIKRQVGIEKIETEKENASFGGKYVRTYNEVENKVLDHKTRNVLPYKKFEIDMLL